MSVIDFTARCISAEASEQIKKASTGFADLDTRLDTMDIAIEQAQQAIHFKGFINYYDDLPDDAEENDAYTVLYAGTSGTEQDGTEYVYSKKDNVLSWNPWGKLTYSQAQIDNKLTTKQDITFTSYTTASQEEVITSNTTVQDAIEQLDYRTQTNKNNISLIKHAANTSIYIQETTPTGAIGDYWLSSANGVKTYGRTAQLFNIDDSNMFYNGYINNNTDVVNYSAGGSKLAIIPCTAGEQYTIAVNSKTLRIAGIATAPINDAPILSPYRYQYDNYEKHTYTYTAPEGAIYLLVSCYLSSIEMVDEKSINDIFGTLMINEGSTAAEFAPYYDWT